MRINGNIELNPLGTSEIVNLHVERLATIPAFHAEEASRLVYITTAGSVGLYANDGTQWAKVATGGDANAIQGEVDALEASLGALVKGDGTFDVAKLTTLTNLTTAGVTTVTGLIQAINDKFGTLSAALEGLTDVKLTAKADKDLLQFDLASGKWVNKSIADAGLQAKDADLDALAALATTGYVVRTGDGTVATRTLGVDANLTVTNADGVAGATSIGLADTAVVPGEYSKLTVDQKGRVTAGAALAAVDVTTALGFTPVNKAGDTLTGALLLAADPVLALGAATKNYVDNVAAGLSWKAPVDEVVADATAFVATAKADGYRIVDLKTSKVFTVKAAALDAGVTPVDGDAVFNKFDETGFVFSGTAWVQFTGGGQVAAGVGLKKNGNRLDVDLGAGLTATPNETDDSAKIVVDCGDGLDLNLADDLAKVTVKADAEASIAVSAAGIKVAATGVKAAHLGADVAGAGLTGGNGVALAVKAADTTIIADAAGVKAAVGKTAGTVAAGDHVHAASEVTFAATADVKSTDVQAAVVELAAKIKNGFFVYTAAAADTTHVVKHNIGSKYCNVTVIDANDEQIIPQSVVFNDDKTLTVSVNTPIIVKVVVAGLAV